MHACDKCGNTPVIIHRKQSGQKLCRDCFINFIQKKVLSNIRRYELIEKGDKVLVALSGGKDSIMTLDILNSLYQRNIIQLVAVTIDEGIKGYRNEGVQIASETAHEWGIKHRLVSFKEYWGRDLDEIMQVNKEKEDTRHACTYCGVLRRWILNKVAQEESATKIATGHNLDDETQSIMMNYLEGNLDNLTRIGVKTESPSPFITKIKPLREIPEKEVALYVMAQDLKVHLAGCPYAGDSFRGEVGRFIKEISINHPTIMYSTLRGFERIKTLLKNDLSPKKTMGICVNCGEPAAKELCQACTFSKELENK